MNIPFNPIKSQSNLSNIANCTIVNSLYLGGAVGFLNGHNYGHNLHKLGYGPPRTIVIHRYSLISQAAPPSAIHHYPETLQRQEHGTRLRL